MRCNIKKITTTAYDFVRLLKQTLKKQRAHVMSQFKTVELRLNKIEKSITSLQLFYKQNVVQAMSAVHLAVVRLFWNLEQKI